LPFAFSISELETTAAAAGAGSGKTVVGIQSLMRSTKAAHSAAEGKASWKRRKRLGWVAVR
jgi:hypothetical protein